MLLYLLSRLYQTKTERSNFTTFKSEIWSSLTILSHLNSHRIRNIKSTERIKQSCHSVRKRQPDFSKFDSVEPSSIAYS